MLFSVLAESLYKIYLYAIQRYKQSYLILEGIVMITNASKTREIILTVRWDAKEAILV